MATTLSDTERLVGDALAAARAKAGGRETGPEMAFLVLKDMGDIHRRMKVRTPSPSRGKSLWPDYIHTYEEKVEAARQRMIDIAAGDAVFDGSGATPKEIATLDAVTELFRAALIGKNKARDWKVLHLLACGATLRRAAKVAHISHARVADIKEMQCAAIWRGVKHLMPAVKPESRVLYPVAA